MPATNSITVVLLIPDGVTRARTAQSLRSVGLAVREMRETRTLLRGVSASAPALVIEPPSSGIEQTLRKVRRPNGTDPAPPKLTPRQIQILGRIARGESTKEIGFNLGLSPKTVEFHRAALMKRLRTRDLAGLIGMAFRWGLVNSEA